MNDAAGERNFLRRYMKYCISPALKKHDFDALSRISSYGVDVVGYINKAEGTVWNNFIGRKNMEAADKKLYDKLYKILMLGVDPGVNCMTHIFSTNPSKRTDKKHYGKRVYYKLKIIKLLYSFGVCWSDKPTRTLYDEIYDYETPECLFILINHGSDPNCNLNDMHDHPLVAASMYRSYSFGLSLTKLLLDAGCEIFNPQSTTPNEYTKRICAKTLRSRETFRNKRFNLLKLFYRVNHRERETKINLIETTLILNLLIEHTF